MLPQAYDDPNMHIKDKLFRAYVSASGVPIYADVCDRWRVNPVNIVNPEKDAKKQHLVKYDHEMEKRIFDKIRFFGFSGDERDEITPLVPDLRIKDIDSFHATIIGSNGLQMSTGSGKYMYHEHIEEFARKEGFLDGDSFREHIRQLILAGDDGYSFRGTIYYF